MIGWSGVLLQLRHLTSGGDSLAGAWLGLLMSCRILLEWRLGLGCAHVCR